MLFKLTRSATYCIPSTPNTSGKRAHIFSFQAFRVLQARFAIVRVCARLLEEEDTCIIMRACITLHNMIVENEHDDYKLTFDYDVVEENTPEPIVNHQCHPCYV